MEHILERKEEGIGVVGAAGIDFGICGHGQERPTC